MRTILDVDNLNYSYGGAPVLTNLSVKFESGNIYAIVGKSGSGKSTLLALLAGLDICSAGEIVYLGKNMKNIDRDEYRAKEVGVIFQSFNLLPNLSAIDNIILSMEISEVEISDKKEYALKLLNDLGIDNDTASRRVKRLSGGEQQRVAIARALSHNPLLILADEPTGNLDEENEKAILDILRRLAKDENKCVIVVTHDQAVIEYADCVYKLGNGCVKIMNNC